MIISILIASKINIKYFFRKNPKISIIIPIFNSEKYLSECLNSIIFQTLKSIEIICIDDGSSDNSINLLNEYKAFEKRLIIIKQTHKGSGYSRNIGIKFSKGTYIAFIDSDDIYPNNYTLEMMFKSAYRNKALISGGGLISFQNKANNTIILSPNFNMQFQKEGIVLYNDYQYDFGYYRFIYKKNFLIKNKIFFPNYLRYQDPPFFIKAMSLAKKFYALQNITYLYREKGKSLTWNELKLLEQFKGLKESFILAEKYNLNKLLCIMFERLNTHSNLFILPIIKNKENKVLIKNITKILKEINFKKKIFLKCNVTLNFVYKNIIHL